MIESVETKVKFCDDAGLNKKLISGVTTCAFDEFGISNSSFENCINQIVDAILQVEQGGENIDLFRKARQYAFTHQAVEMVQDEAFDYISSLVINLIDNDSLLVIKGVPSRENL